MANYNIQATGKNCSVTPTGDLTAHVVPELQAAIKQQLQQGVSEVVFDLAATAMLDSSGIGLLIATSNSLSRQQGRVRVINVAPDILQLLQSMRLVTRLNASGRTN
jgi:anti-sigma B factor antagonist